MKGVDGVGDSWMKGPLEQLEQLDEQQELHPNR